MTYWINVTFLCCTLSTLVMLSTLHYHRIVFHFFLNLFWSVQDKKLHSYEHLFLAGPLSLSAARTELVNTFYSHGFLPTFYSFNTSTLSRTVVSCFSVIFPPPTCVAAAPGWVIDWLLKLVLRKSGRHLSQCDGSLRGKARWNVCVVAHAERNMER